MSDSYVHLDVVSDNTSEFHDLLKKQSNAGLSPSA